MAGPSSLFHRTGKSTCFVIAAYVVMHGRQFSFFSYFFTEFFLIGNKCFFFFFFLGWGGAGVGIKVIQG